MQNKADNVMTETKLSLEAVMTQSVFDHHYALENLNATKVAWLHREELLREMEEHKKAYFWARDILAQLDPDKLDSLEEELRVQKMVLFQDSVTVH